MNALVLTIGIFGSLLLGLVVFVIILFQKISRLTKGNSVESLEKVIIENNKLAHEIEKNLEEHKVEILALQKDTLKNIQNIGVVRFNPFKETGGSQSFAIAITDKEENGVIISSFYTRDRVNVFAKPINKGVSEYTLTPEEQAAIKKSRN